jgi:hypothetical protein
MSYVDLSDGTFRDRRSPRGQEADSATVLTFSERSGKGAGVVKGRSTALITAWLEVRVLPGPPPKILVFDLSLVFARIAKPVSVGLAVLFTLWSF